MRARSERFDAARAAAEGEGEVAVVVVVGGSFFVAVGRVCRFGWLRIGTGLDGERAGAAEFNIESLCWREKFVSVGENEDLCLYVLVL